MGGILADSLQRLMFHDLGVVLNIYF